ncbi:UDP-glucuronic acid decarboxylase family protein [Thermocrinis minervae]|uniref:UDP-glucuronate decarboxylase n=1 Tax=Thermocrinis minervae TaxID=381751 RepID=A0A1M6RXX0_9AQUI|nr:UDP-glucuronic acid decarboxylase family protein [Thermocrinis minervae]SHK37301.1 dTDP-glucose 4,6-dehydratase [Thermocrinis minervae]
MRVLITGVAGFIGSHLCEKFLDEGHEVIGLDNFLTGSPDNIAHLFGHPRFKFIHYNVVNFLYVDGPIDLVVHLACPASPVDYLNNPIHTMKVNSLGTLNSLGLAKLKRARYVFASSSEVYGDPLVHPQREDYWGNVNPIGPRSVYDEAKRFSEAMCMAYHREHSLDVRIARIFNTYGERMRIGDGRVIPTFIQQALEGKDITIHSDGSQTRSFCYISDMVEGLYKLSVEEGLVGEVVNLGNPQEVTIKQLAEIIIMLTGSKSRITYTEGRVDDPRRRCPDISKARRLLGWEPKVDLEEGLLRTIEWFRRKCYGTLR